MRWPHPRSLDCFLFLATGLTGWSQQVLPSSAHLTGNPSGSSSVPIATEAFAFYHNRVYLPVRVNGRDPISMVVDTGAGFSGLNEQTADAMQLSHKAHAELNGNGDNTTHISLAKDLTFTIGAASLSEKIVAVVPYGDLERLEGRRIEGILGVEFFRRYVVVIDYPRRMLSIYEPASFVYSGAGEVVPLTFGKGAAMFQAMIHVSNRDMIPAKLAVDTGTYGGLRLYSPFTKKHASLLAGSPALDSFGFGVGGEFPEKLGRVQSLQLGGLEVHAPVVSFPGAERGATASDAYDGTIGGGILSHYTVIFDYARQRLIFEAGPHASDPFGGDTSGLILQANLPALQGNGSADRKMSAVSVRHALVGTPAASAGFQAGDIVVSVDGIAADEVGMDGIRLKLMLEGSYGFQLLRGKQSLRLTLTTTGSLY